MAIDDGERLVLLLEARITQFEKNLQKANRTAGRSFGDIEKRGQQSAARLETSFTRAGAGVQAGIGRLNGALGTLGLGAGIGVAAAIASIKTAVNDLATVAADAKMAGLDNGTFQELSFAAGQSRIGIDAVTDGLKELQLRGDEFAVTGKGSAAEAFARIGMTPEEVQTRLKDPADMLETIMGRIHDLDRAAQIRILDELLGGTAGEQFIRFLAHGQDGIAKLRQEARDTGMVLSDDVLAEAEKIDREFLKISTTIDRNIKGSIVSVIAATREWLEELQKGLTEIGSSSIWMRIANALPQDPFAPKPTLINEWNVAGTQLAELIQDQGSWELQLADARKVAAETGIDVDRDRVKVIEDRIAALKREEQQLRAMPGTPSTPSYGRANVQKFPAEPKPFTPGETEAERRAREAAEKARADAARAAQREADGIARVIDQLRFEEAQLGRTEVQQRIANELRNAGTATTSAQRQEIERLVNATYEQEQAAAAAEEAQRKLTAAWDAAEGIAANALGDVISGLRQGESAADALSAALDRVIDKLIDMATQEATSALFDFGKTALGFGGAASGPTSIVPPGFAKGAAFDSGRITPFASGGVVNRATLFPMRNGTGLMGEAGPEGILPLRRLPGGDLGVQSTTGRGGGNVQTITLAPSVTINAKGGTQEQNKDLADQVTTQIERSMRGLIAVELRQQMRPGGLLYA
ncbi:hypothetical protein FHS85_001963 [Rhodoligotrophos appendicifer]|uniref:hypothetical protein n=1 Tax=Rhodoligotrophos appendicifer TaxID=987056 RepID=UPI001186BAB8|nr:hypothetical protein [Rhodoligotrophos appendicifer]